MEVSPQIPLPHPTAATPSGISRVGRNLAVNLALAAVVVFGAWLAAGMVLAAIKMLGIVAAVMAAFAIIIVDEYVLGLFKPRVRWLYTRISGREPPSYL